MSKVFGGCVIALAGFPAATITDLSKAIREAGGEVSSVISNRTTHVVATQSEVTSNSFKVKSAIKYKAFVVSEPWIHQSISAGVKLGEDQYFLGDQQPSEQKDVRFLSSSGGAPLSSSAEDIPAATQSDQPPNFSMPKGYNHKNVGVAKFGQPGSQNFPDEHTILVKHVLQVTDIQTNHNKYYGLELQHGIGKGGQNMYRIFTHYGRTDDLEKNPDSGMKELRYCNDLASAQACYQSIYNEKVSPKKGYRPVSLASSNIGSVQARGPAHQTEAASSVRIPSSLPMDIQDFVEYIFSEATSALTSSIAAKITPNGIETPLGILTLQQIEKGEAILVQLYDLVRSGNPDRKQLEHLSGEFYSFIPHRIGRSKADLAASVISTMKQFEEKQELLQLMKDMIQVNQQGQVLFSSGLDLKYKALKCQIAPLRRHSTEFEEVEEFVLRSQVKNFTIDVVNIFAVRREAEWQNFKSDIPNQRTLVHGSRISNWVGLLSRGLLMPKIVTSMGGGRTDAGFLGNGIYFGESSCTAAQYTSPGKKGTRFMLVCRVALGKMKEYTKITQGAHAAPEGYHSVGGIRRKDAEGGISDFEDNEYVVFDTAQQRQEYLVEFKLKDSGIPLSYSSNRPADPRIPSDTWFERRSDDSTSPAGTSWRMHPTAAPSNITPSSTSVAPSRMHQAGSLASAPSASSSVPTPSWRMHTSAAAPTPSPTTNTTSASSRMHPSSDSSSGDSSASMTSEQQDTKEKEDHYRQLFAQGGYASELSDPYLHLENVFERQSDYNAQSETSDERKIPKLFQKPGQMGPGAAPQDFKKNWDHLTGNLLKGLNWRNVFAAGGSVLSTLMPNYSNAPESNKGSDIDIFIYGLDPEQATEKIKEIYSVVQSNTPNSRTDNIVRTDHAVTIIGQYPLRHIQIILRCYKSPAEVLMGFDIDCCCVGYDGDKVWALPRARRAITKGYNLVDLSRRSLTYEIRLHKYSKRGFAVAIPSFDRSSVQSSVTSRPVSEVKGLAKLLILEARGESSGSAPFTGRRGRRFGIVKLRGPQLDREDEFSRHGLLEAKTVADDRKGTSDYDGDVFIPWGPDWTLPQVLKQLNKKDKALFFSGAKKQEHRHLFISGGISGIVEGKSSYCFMCAQATSSSTQKDLNHYVPVPLVNSWVTENPGRQGLLTSSFHPVEDGDWFAEAYSGASSSSAGASVFAQQVRSRSKSPEKKSFTSKKTPKKSSYSFGGESTSSPKYTPSSPTYHPASPEYSPTSPEYTSNAYTTPQSPQYYSQQSSYKASPPTTPGHSSYSGWGSSDTYASAASQPTPSAFGGGVVPPSPSTYGGGSSYQVAGPSPSAFGGPASRPPQSPSRDVSSVYGGGTSAGLDYSSFDQYGSFTGTGLSQFGAPSSPQKKTPAKRTTAQPAVFGSSFGTTTVPSFPQPAASFSTPTPSGLFGAPSAPTSATLKQVFKQTEAPKSPVAKLLLLTSMLFKGGKISESEKDKIKDMIIKADQSVLSALEVFEVENDFDELADTFRRLSRQ